MPNFFGWDKGWNTSDSHDSSLNEEDMKTLVRRICGDVPNMKDQPLPGNMPQPIQTLSNILQDKVKNDPVIHIMNGIHQADELHFTLKVTSAYIGSFHIYVAKGAPQVVYSKPVKAGGLANKTGTAGKVMPHTLCLYKCVGITYVANGGTLQWPLNFNRNSYPGRQRGNSLSETKQALIQKTGPSAADINSGKLMDPPKS